MKPSGKKSAQAAEEGLARTVLYYPTINVPTGTWLRQALLYWDKVGSIVPQSYDDDTTERGIARYGSDIHRLYDERIFRPFNPDLLMRSDSGEIQQFSQELKSELRNQKFASLLPPRAERKLDVAIYKQKLTDSVFSHLRKLGLAEERHETREDYYCYYFERRAALLYMTLLAKYLAKVDRSGITTPSTDQRIYLNLSHMPAKRTDAAVCLSTKLKDMLVVPSNETPIKDILAFRKQHRLQLLDFRRELDSFQAELEKCQDDSEITSKATKFSEKIELEVGKLGTSLRKSGITTILGSLQAFIKANSPAIVGGAAVLAGAAATLTAIPVPIVLAGAGGVGAIEVAAHLIKRSDDRTAVFDGNPFSYLYLAKKEFGNRR